MIERATMAEQYPVAKPRTKVQELQSRQWQALGTLHRTRANLYTIMDAAIYPAAKRQLHETIQLIDKLISWNIAAQRSLPSIKNKKLVEKAKAEKS